MPTLSKADEPRNPEEEEEMRKFPYRKAVGALMWTATMTRPDIACAVRAVARFCENPGPAHKKAVMKIFQYLLHTKEWGITYCGQGCGLCMEAYTDSDFWSLPGHETIGFGCGVDAGEGSDQLALKDARSDSIGYLGGRVRCLIRGGKGSTILRQVQEFMEPSMRVGAVNMFENNERVIKLAPNKHASRRTKHIYVKHHLVRNASDARKVRVAYVGSEDQHADLLTKPLDLQKFYKHAKFILNVV